MKIKSKGLTSILLASTFAVVVVSGGALYLSPKGRVANWTGWTLSGLSKQAWEALHLNACLLMLLVVALHLFFNWRVFWSYIRRQATGFHLKLEMTLAVLLVTALVSGTIYRVPPLTTATALGERIKAYWEQSAQQGPAPHAEEFPLPRFARSIGLEPDELIAALEKEGLKFTDTRVTVAELARQNQLVPAEVYSAVTKHFPQAMQAGAGPRGGGGRGYGRGPGGGFGRGR